MIRVPPAGAVPDGVIGLERVRRRTCLTFLLLSAEGLVQSNCVCAASTAGLTLNSASMLLVQSQACGSEQRSTLDPWRIRSAMSFVSICTSDRPIGTSITPGSLGIVPTSDRKSAR